MLSRFLYAALFLVLILTLTTCAIDSNRHYKELGKAVAKLNIALMPPILGNGIIILSTNRILSLMGCYIYFVGMDIVVYELMMFTVAYCKGAGRGQKPPAFIRYILAADVVQLLINPFTRHAFDVEEIFLDGQSYYNVVPLLGQTIHRIVDYGVFLAVILIFVLTTVNTSRIYRERYSIIMITMVLVGVWESYYIFSDNPIDRSMLGFGAFGVLIYYFSIHYRPLRLLDRMLSGIVSNGSEACFIFSPRGRCVWANNEGCLLVGVQENNCENAPDLLEYLFNIKLRKGNWSEQVVTGGEDSVKYYLLENNDVINDKGRVTGYYLKVKDVTEEQLKIRREMYEATHDKLTGLYTRDFLYKAIQSSLDAHPDTEYMVLFINIKSFKIVNDIFGTDFGDYAIKCLADKLRNVFPKGSIYGRIAGDNFGILIPKNEFNSAKLEEELLHITIKRDKVKYPIQIQMGAYEVVRGESEVPDMFAKARLALATINGDEDAHIAYYDDEIKNEILWNQELSAQLADAIRRGNIVPYLQPIADSEGNIVGAEALVRWMHKEHGFLTPVKFIPALEKNGMIAEVDKYMWRCACRILADWKKQGRDTFISVNISPKDFYYMDVPEYIRDLVREFDIEPSKLRVEITETVMVNDTDKMIDIMNEFRRSGFIVEMDDFGSGYSSLNMLKEIPVDVLKIDMNFLGSAENAAKADIIVRNVIKLSQELGIASITEGIETQSQYDGLSEMGCELFQGFYFSEPLPTDRFEELLNSGTDLEGS
ncbi:MAG: EAL domain-containing protein [Clostridiales bacterium]|nr:EAL domain-containing protein [Clostridiales bacterium]